MMKRVLKIAARLLLGFLGLVVVLLGAALGYRAYRQLQSDKAMAIAGVGGIDEAMFVKIGGIDQWMTIRGQDRQNPVLLILHGGPGVALWPGFPGIIGLEQDFIVVQWDQRGSAKTFGKSGPVGSAVTIEQMAQDGLEVAEYLRSHLQKQKIILVGISWGTILGIEMAQARPDLFYAYVGTGQVVNQHRADALDYAQLLAAARARADQSAIRRLESIGPPPWDKQWKLGVRSNLASAYEPGVPSLPAYLAALCLAPRYTLWDVRNWVAGFLSSEDHFLGNELSGPGMAVDLTAFGTDFTVPIFIFQGAADNITPAELVQEYFAGIKAPQKQLLLIPGAGHQVATTKPGEFLKFLAERVRPLAVQPASVQKTNARSAR